MAERVLVIDDNVVNQKLVAFLMKTHGYEVDTAGDAETAMDAIRARHPDVILMDIQLPRVDGLELTGWLKRDPQTRDIIIIAVTAYAMKGDKERALDAGCDDYVTKPIDTRELPAMIRRHLEARRGA